jgi:hypothetical protein
MPSSGSPPDVFWLENGREAELEELLAEGPLLLCFYLFDWSPT